MRTYELFCLLKAGFDIENVDQSIKNIETTIKNLGGNVSDCNKVGRKKLAYDIAGSKDSFCAIFKVDIAPDKLNELKRLLKLNESVLRDFITHFKPATKTASEPDSVPQQA